MDEIKKILLCGLGGLGSICAVAISDTKAGELKVLVDSTRFERYKTEKTYFNNKEYGFDFVLPEKTGFKADLIIIATKTDGLDFAINNIKNFVHKDTIIISLLNGIHSEEKISEIYKDNNVFITFYIGHSCIREGRNIYQDGTYEFVIGTAEENKKEFLNILVSFFDKANIHYRLSENIKAEYWRKFMINVGINQLSAVTGLTLKDIKKDVLLKENLKNLMLEAAIAAEKEGIKDSKEIFESAFNFLINEIDDAKPSMLQDIESGRKTEADIFAGEIIRIGQKYGIKMPYNETVYQKIKELECTAKIRLS